MSRISPIRPSFIARHPMSPKASSSIRREESVDTIGTFSEVEIEDSRLQEDEDTMSESEGTEGGSGDEFYKNGEGSSGNIKGKGVAPSDRQPGSPLTGQDRPKSGKKAGSWSDIDLSLVVALVSPIGNWLTGSDHVKNLFLILLLIFYLHQLVEVPWQLYHASRAKRSGRRFRASSDTGNFRAEASQASKLAASELRTQELFYLGLTVISPVLGASLIRYVLTAVEGVDNLSWFSTTLFVLATGIRPWSHLISRVRQRTQDLHDAVHYPSQESPAYYQMELEKKLRTVLQRLDSIEGSISDLKEQSDKIQPLREVCDDLTEAVGVVERTLGRQERRSEATRVNQDNRMTAMETALVQLEQRRQQDKEAIEAKFGFSYGRMYSSFLPSVFTNFLRAPPKSTSLTNPYVGTFVRHSHTSGLADANENRNGVGVVTLNPIPPHPDPLTPTTQYLSRLETIPEADDSDSEGTYVSDLKEPQHTPLSPKRISKHDLANGRSRSQSLSSNSGRPQLHRQLSYKTKVMDYALDLVAWPYRSAVKILLLIAPPIQNLVM